MHKVYTYTRYIYLAYMAFKTRCWPALRTTATFSHKNKITAVFELVVVPKWKKHVQQTGFIVHYVLNQTHERIPHPFNLE